MVIVKPHISAPEGFRLLLLYNGNYNLFPGECQHKQEKNGEKGGFHSLCAAVSDKTGQFPESYRLGLLRFCFAMDLNFCFF